MHNTSPQNLGFISIDLIYSANCLFLPSFLLRRGGDVDVGVKDDAHREVTNHAGNSFGVYAVLQS